MQYINKRDHMQYLKDVAEFEQQELEWKIETQRQKNKKYREAHPLNKELVKCECGLLILDKNLNSHRARKIHRTRLLVFSD